MHLRTLFDNATNASFGYESEQLWGLITAKKEDQAHEVVGQLERETIQYTGRHLLL